MLARLQQLFTKYLGRGNDFAALPQSEQIRRQNRLHADPEYQRLKAAAAAQPIRTRRSAHLDACAMSGYAARP